MPKVILQSQASDISKSLGFSPSSAASLELLTAAAQAQLVASDLGPGPDEGGRLSAAGVGIGRGKRTDVAADRGALAEPATHLQIAEECPAQAGDERMHAVWQAGLGNLLEQCRLEVGFSERHRLYPADIAGGGQKSFEQRARDIAHRIRKERRRVRLREVLGPICERLTEEMINHIPMQCQMGSNGARPVMARALRRSRVRKFLLCQARRRTAVARI